MQAFPKISTALLVAVSSVLVACGGGGGGGSSTGVLKTVTASATDTASSSSGQDVLVAGTATSAQFAMKTMAWQAQAVTAGAPDLVLTNGDCAKAITQNQQGTNAGGQAYTTSNWQCTVDVKAPRLAADSQYQLLLTATDSNGTVDTHITTLTIQATPGSPSTSTLAADAGSTLTLTSGSPGQVQCLGSGGQLATGSSYTYQWVQTDGANAALTLSSRTAAAPTFNAPAVNAPATVTLQCRVSDDAGTTATATKSVVINPAPGVALIVSAGNSSVVAPGQTVVLDGSATGFVGLAGQTSPQVYYQWVQTSGPTLNITNANLQSASVVIPNDVTDSTPYSFQLQAADAPIGTTATHSGTASVNVTADPVGQLALSLETPSQSVAKNVAALMTAKISANVNSPVYYSWTQISGPVVSLGGALTSQAGFVGPVVASPTTFVFRVTVGYKPITGGYSGVATADAVVVVTP